MLKKLRHHITSWFTLQNLVLAGLVLLVTFLFSDTAWADDVPCRPSDYRENLRTCWFCQLFEVVFNTCSTIAIKAYQTLAKPVAYVVAVGMGIWVVMTLLSFVSSIESKDAKGLIKQILNQSFLVMIVMFFLMNDTSSFFSLALEPIFNTGFKLAQVVVMPLSGNCTSGSGIMTDGGLPPSMGKSIVCTIQVLQNSLQDVMSIGYSAMCVGFRQKAIIPFLIPHFGYLISGLLIWLGALILLIVFPFLLIDSVLQLAVASALLPAAIGAYTFKFTRKYTGNIWKTFMTAMFNFIFLSIIIAILAEAVRQTLSESIDNATSEKIINEGAIDWILTGLSWTGVAWLKIVFILLLAWAVLKEANSFAKSFGGGGFSSDLGTQIGGVGASGAMNIGKKIGGAAWGESKKFFGAVKDTVKEKVGARRMERSANRLNRRFQNAKDNGDGTRTYTNRWGRKFTMTQNADGGISAKHKTIFGNEVTKGYSVGEDNNISVSRNKAHKGVFTGKIKETRKESNGIVSVKSHYVDGELKQQDEPVITSAAAKHLVNNDGTIDENAKELILNSGGLDDKTKQLVLVKATIAQSIPNSDINIYGRFNSQEVVTGTDEKGRSYTEVIEKRGNQTYRYRLTAGDNGRMLSEINIESSNKNGQTRVKKLATDGIFNHSSNNVVDSETGELIREIEPSATTFNNHYKKKRIVDAYGAVSDKVPVQDSLFDQDKVDSAVSLEKDIRLGRRESVTLNEFR